MSTQIMIILLCLIDAALSLNAYVVLHCDNNGTLFESTDNRTTFKFIKNEDDWMEPLETTIANVTSNTILRFKCEDDGDNHGGFISTIKYENIQYSTTNPITNGFFMVIASSDNKTSPLEYKNKTSEPWKSEISGSLSSEIDNDAYWIWNGQIGNTMIFEFHFADLFTPSPTSTPTDNPTKTPSLDPTLFPTTIPSKNPSNRPSSVPTLFPTTTIPSKHPSMSPSKTPTKLPTERPSISYSSTTPAPILILDGNSVDSAKPTMMDNEIVENEQQTTVGVKHQEDTPIASDSLLIALLIVTAVLICFICCIVILIMRHKKVYSLNKEQNKMIQIELQSRDRSIDYIVDKGEINKKTGININNNKDITSSTVPSLENHINDAAITIINYGVSDDNMEMDNLMHSHLLSNVVDPKNAMNRITAGISDNEQYEDDELYINTGEKTEGDEAFILTAEGINDNKQNIKVSNAQTSKGNEETYYDSNTKFDNNAIEDNGNNEDNEDNDDEDDNDDNESTDDDIYKSVDQPGNTDDVVTNSNV